MNQVEEALAAIEAGNVQKGLELLNEAEKKTTKHEEKYQLAEIYYELGHLERAKVIVDELLLLYPDEGSLYVMAAEIMIDHEQEDEAIDLLLEIGEDDPAFLQAQLLLADLYQMQALDEVAEQKLLLAAQKAPDEVIISYGLGEFYLERGDYNKSIPYLKKVLHSSEPLPDVQIELKMAEAYSASGQFEEAMYYYQQGLKEKLEPNAFWAMELQLTS